MKRNFKTKISKRILSGILALAAVIGSVGVDAAVVKAADDSEDEQLIGYSYDDEGSELWMYRYDYTTDYETLEAMPLCQDVINSCNSTPEEQEMTDERWRTFLDPNVHTADDAYIPISGADYAYMRDHHELESIGGYVNANSTTRGLFVSHRSREWGSYGNWNYYINDVNFDTDKVVEISDPYSMSAAKKLDKLLRKGNDFCIQIDTDDDNAYMTLIDNVGKINKNAVRPACKCWRFEDGTVDNPISGTVRKYYFTEDCCEGYLYANKWVKKIYKQAMANAKTVKKSFGQYYKGEQEVWFNLKKKNFCDMSDALKIAIISKSGYFSGNKETDYGIKYVDGYDGSGEPDYGLAWKKMYKGKIKGVCADFTLFELIAFRTLGIKTYDSDCKYFLGYPSESASYNYNVTFQSGIEGHEWSIVEVENAKGKKLWIPFDYRIKTDIDTSEESKEEVKEIYTDYLGMLLNAPKNKNFKNSDLFAGETKKNIKAYNIDAWATFTNKN